MKSFFITSYTIPCRLYLNPGLDIYILRSAGNKITNLYFLPDIGMGAPEPQLGDPIDEVPVVATDVEIIVKGVLGGLG